MTNTSGIQPVEYKVLVLPEEIEEETEGKHGSPIIMPETTKEKDQWAQIKAILIAIGGSAFCDPDWKQPIPQIGDQVYIAKYAGNFIEGKDGKEYRLCSDKDIGAIRKE